MEFLTKFLDKFEQFIKRAMMPSIVFFIMYAIVFIIVIYIKKDFNQLEFIVLLKFFMGIKFDITSFILFFILLIGLSHILSVLTQMIFDNNIKEDYISDFNIESENNNLKNLRKKVVNKLNTESSDFKDDIELTDFMLYQIVSRKLAYYNKKTPTERYVDDAKASGITFVSLIIVTLINLTIYYGIFIAITVSILFTYIGYTYIKSKYRSRATRIYVNYLIGEHK